MLRQAPEFEVSDIGRAIAKPTGVVGDVGTRIAQDGTGAGVAAAAEMEAALEAADPMNTGSVPVETFRAVIDQYTRKPTAGSGDIGGIEAPADDSDAEAGASIFGSSPAPAPQFTPFSPEELKEIYAHAEATSTVNYRQLRELYRDVAEPAAKEPELLGAEPGQCTCDRCVTTNDEVDHVCAPKIDRVYSPCTSESLPGLDYGAPLEVFCVKACKVLDEAGGTKCYPRTPAEIAAYEAALRGDTEPTEPPPTVDAQSVARTIKGNFESAKQSYDLMNDDRLGLT